MFYHAGGIFWSLFSPSNLLPLLTILAAVALFTRFRRGGRNTLIAVAIVYLTCGFGPVGAILIRPLEDRFPLPSEITPDPTGIIVLGGALKAGMTDARSVPALSEAGGRLTQTAVLARRFPNARIVFSGGTQSTGVSEADEAHAARRFLISLGISADRILLEDHSRNTDENARFTRGLVMSRPGDRWVLVTSARHMPRAVGAFRNAGFDVIAFPTDYLSLGDAHDFWDWHMTPAVGITLLDAALHEWSGLIAYRLAGKTNSLLPGPIDTEPSGNRNIADAP